MRNGDMESNRSSHPDTDAAAVSSAAPSSRPGLGQRVNDLAAQAPWERGVFHRFARTVRGMAGSPRATGVLAGGFAGWLAIGPVVHFSRAWELTATAGAPITGLILLLLIQHTQNRDDRAMQLKLNELIRADDDASDRMIGIEESTAPDLVRLQDEYRQHTARPHHPVRGRRRRLRAASRSPWRARTHAESRLPWKVVWSAGGAGDRGDAHQIVCSRHATEMSARREARRLTRIAERTLPADERTWRCSVARAGEACQHG
jgi:low affinity Fe/Cu permease